jgi:hypothetical protein
VVCVKLKRDRLDDGEEEEPVERAVATDIYVLPVDVVRGAWEGRRQRERTADSFNKVHLSDIPDVEQYRDAYELIREALRDGA